MKKNQIMGRYYEICVKPQKWWVAINWVVLSQDTSKQEKNFKTNYDR